MTKLNKQYWDTRYQQHQTGWDTGAPTTPFVEFFKTLENKGLRILIPGCGHAYEGELLHQLGFKNVFLLDLSPTARNEFLARVPTFNPENFLLGDFFTHKSTYDLILEQTFFCAINPELRPAYAEKVPTLLNPGGQLAGVLFTFPLSPTGPPFGGSIAEYLDLFQPKFKIKTLEPCYNSIQPRAGNEAFIRLMKA